MIINSPTELVFRDLFYRLEDFADGHEVFLKLEGMHITGSIKFKTAMGLIEDLERRGVSNPAETTIVESSSGNLGIALSLVCAAKGYRFICVTDPKANRSNIKGMQLYGAEVIVVDKPDPVDGFLGTRLKLIQHLLKTEPNAIWLNQYANLAAKNVHAEQTAEEIIAEFEKVDWIFIGSGTTGTITGVAERLRQKFPHIKVIAVEPEGSVTFGGEPKKRSIPGIGTSVRPPLADHVVPDEVITISEPRTVDSCREFVRDYHLLVGGSTGAVLAAVRQKSSQFKPGETVVAISPDLGEKYLDTVYDPAWVAANINQIISNLEKGDVAWMATTGNERRASKGEVLITAGEPVESLLIVLDGELSVMLDTESVARLTAGDIVGEMSLIEDRPPTVSVMCATDARVLAIPFSEIRRHLDSDTAFASRFHRAFAVFLSHRLRATMARLNAPSGGQRPPLNAALDGMRQLLSHLDGGTVRETSSQFKPGETVVAISPDLGPKHLDPIYDPAWVAANINQIITDLENGDVAWMATTGNERRVSKGEVLITAGEPVEALLIVLDGELSVMLDTDETVARLTAGDIVGEMSLIEDRPPTASVMCATDARVLAIPYKEIRRRLDSDTAFASRFHRAFAVFLSHRLRATMARLGYGGSKGDGQASVGVQNAPGGGQSSPLNAARDGMRQLLSHLDGGT